MINTHPRGCRKTDSSCQRSKARYHRDDPNQGKSHSTSFVPSRGNVWGLRSGLSRLGSCLHPFRLLGIALPSIESWSAGVGGEGGTGVPGPIYSQLSGITFQPEGGRNTLENIERDPRIMT